MKLANSGHTMTFLLVPPAGQNVAEVVVALVAITRGDIL